MKEAVFVACRKPASLESGAAEHLLPQEVKPAELPVLHSDFDRREFICAGAAAGIAVRHLLLLNGAAKWLSCTAHFPGFRQCLTRKRMLNGIGRLRPIYQLS